MTFCLPGTDRGRGVPIPFCACVLHLKQEQYVFRFTNAWNSSAWGKKKFTIRPQAVLFCFVVFYFFWSGNYPPPSVYLGRQNVIHMIKWSRPTLSVRNVIGRENLITSGQTNELAHAVWTGTVVQLRYVLYGWQNGTIDGTMLHYLVVWKAIVSIHRPVHSKIMLT